MKLSLIFPPIVIGIVSGVMGALCGVGGGIIMVPAFTQWLGLSQKQAVATSLLVIVPTALAGVLRYSKEGLIDWKIGAWTALGAVSAAWVASDWLKRFQNETLTRVFGGLLVLIGLKMLLRSKG